jgi:hypothetical protein
VLFFSFPSRRELGLPHNAKYKVLQQRERDRQRESRTERALLHVELELDERVLHHRDVADQFNQILKSGREK